MFLDAATRTRRTKKLARLTPPFDAETERELIALAIADADVLVDRHEDNWGKARAATQKLIDKLVPDAQLSAASFAHRSAMRYARACMLSNLSLESRCRMTRNRRDLARGCSAAVRSRGHGWAWKIHRGPPAGRSRPRSTCCSMGAATVPTSPARVASASLFPVCGRSRCARTGSERRRCPLHRQRRRRSGASSANATGSGLARLARLASYMRWSASVIASAIGGAGTIAQPTLRLTADAPGGTI
jgi:hypothetical protein